MNGFALLNDNDKQACAWLRQLVAYRHLPVSTVLEKPIQEVTADDIKEHTQVHLFAGIGGWPLALRLAGWPDNRPVWTGSCPCQPFSAAGKGRGNADERHLWPAMHRLISECRPDTIFGEQAASAIGHGWLDGISADMEAEGYTVGAVVLGAHSVGAPHQRQRLFWVADTSGERVRAAGQETDAGPSRAVQTQHGERQRFRIDAGAVGGPVERARTAGGPWSDYIIIPCEKGKSRRIEPSTCPMVDGFPGRVGLLRGYGNAIVPQVAAEFIAAFMLGSPTPPATPTPAPPCRH